MSADTKRYEKNLRDSAAIGLATSLFSGRGPAYSASRQVLIGAAAAGITYATGALIGVSLS